MIDLNKLIGIPFKLNRKDFNGCDCRGICWLYYKYAKDKEYPFTDGGRVFFRNKKKDLIRMINVIKTFARQVKFEELQEGDLVLLKGGTSSGALGVCINNKQLLHMDMFVGSCLTKLRYIEGIFITGFRPNV